MEITVIRFLAFALAALTPAFAQTVVALDGYHNNESKMPDHYQWDGARPGGFSELGKLLRENGADELRTLRHRIDDASLRGVSLLIIVDPDTPSETADPKYIEDGEADAIAAWVKQGGSLVLLGNDKGNAEFEHLNRLAAKFGITFLEDTYPKVRGKGILVATGTDPIFEGGKSVYLVEVAPLKLTRPAMPVLADHGAIIMALARYGKGQVFALGDPWVYNEYIDHENNREIAAKLFRRLLGK